MTEEANDSLEDSQCRKALAALDSMLARVAQGSSDDDGKLVWKKATFREAAERALRLPVGLREVAGENPEAFADFAVEYYSAAYYMRTPLLRSPAVLADALLRMLRSPDTAGASLVWFVSVCRKAVYGEAPDKGMWSPFG